MGTVTTAPHFKSRLPPDVLIVLKDQESTAFTTGQEKCGKVLHQQM